ncbi:MAG TPA: AI-2E family transporter [Chloroflexota bacterium]
MGLPLSSADDQTRTGARVPSSAKLFLVVCGILLIVVLLLQAQAILSPFLWALFAAYLLSPVVRYLNVRGGLPRLWSVMLIYASIALALVAGSRYLYPQVVSDGTVFLEDIPRLEAALIGLVGPSPMGIDIASLVTQLTRTIGGYTSDTKSASHLLVNAFETFAKVFLFLVSTFYLLMDASRIRVACTDILPPAYRDELIELARRIHSTWLQYMRGELLLFVLMATVTSIALTLFGVPGAIFLGLLSGALELLPLVGPLTAGTVAVAVAYFNGSNPWGWSQIAYAGAIAVLYLVLRNAEDYFVIPHVLGRAVRLHPLVILFSVAAGGVIGGLFGLIIAVPIAASIREIATYVYAKLLDQPVLDPPVVTADVPVIELRRSENGNHAAQDTEPTGTPKAKRVDTGT